MSVIASLLALVGVGVPLIVIIGVVTAVAWMAYSGEIHSFWDLVRVVDPIQELITKDEFLAIPLFMASGAIMTKGGLARRLIDIMSAALGWLPGGLAISAVAACMWFAAISGSSPVTLIAVGSIMVPAMIAQRYPENFSLGMVMTAGSLGCLVPPAISMLIYAISVSSLKGGVDSDDLFLAGAVPALFIAGALAVYAFIVGLKVRREQKAAGDIPPRFSAALLGKALRDGVWALLLPVVILGGIYSGAFTPSKAGAVAVVYALCVTMFIYRELTWKSVVLALAEAGKLMGMLVLIIGLAFALNNLLVEVQIDEKLKELVTTMDLGPVGFMLLVNVVLIVLGALMDSISATLVFAPMLAPLAVEHYGIDPLHFGIVFVVNMEIGYLMPPVATNLFVAAATFKRPFEQVAKAVLPTLGITILSLGVFMFVPTCSKGLVNLKRDGDKEYGAVAFWEDFPWDGKPVTEAAGDDGGLSGIMQKTLDHEDDPDPATTPTKTDDGADAAGEDPMQQYKNNSDDMGIGEPSDPDAGPAPGSDAEPGAEKPVDPMDKYKKNADDMGF